MDRGAWQATIDEAAKSWTWLTWTQAQLTLYLKESAHMSAGTHIQNTQTQRSTIMHILPFSICVSSSLRFL